MSKKDEEDRSAANKRKSPSSRVIHDAVLAEGDEEVERPAMALAWSGLAAGLSMGFSLIAEGLLRNYLPDAPWRSLVDSLGYSVGFFIVVLGRQQLFTENTLTAVLPLLHERTKSMFLKVVRLWAVVLAANLVGGAAVAIVSTITPAFDSDIQNAFVEIGREAMEPGWWTILLRGIYGGWIIALIVWLLPFAEAARLWIIIFLTYLIALGHLSHVIAGSIEVFAVAAAGEISWFYSLFGYTLPTLIGNVIGGVMLVAGLNHAQVVATGRMKSTQEKKESGA